MQTLLTFYVLPLPASYFCHQGLGLPCIFVKSFIYQQLIMTSNGKSSIVEERLYSLFFALFHNKFFRFSSSSQSITKTFVLLRSCTILKGFTSFCFVSSNFLKTPIRFTFDFESVGIISFASLRSSKILEQPGRFRFDLQKFRDKQFILFSILPLIFELNSFLLRS
jgi:hypothetical protein